MGPTTIDDCKDILQEEVCKQKKKEKKCNKDNVQVNCKKTCDQCSPPPTTQPTPTDCEGVEKDEESMDFCEKKKDKKKCEQFKKECLVTCGFCNPNITTNITTLPPTTPTIDDCKDILQEEVCKKKKDKK